MRRKLVLEMALIFYLIGMLGVGLEVQRVKASGTILIGADGRVEPLTAPILNIGNVSYTFTDNIYDEIVVERSNIIIDGNRYALQGLGSGNGFSLYSISNVTIRNTNIKGFFWGVYISRSSYNSIVGNNITENNDGGILLGETSSNNMVGNKITENNRWGIRLIESSNNSIVGNNITDSKYGIELETYSNYNIVSGNNITNNTYGIKVLEASNNKIYHNNFIDNTQYTVSRYYTNLLDNGYPSGGNYWSGYGGVDRYSGPYQNETGADGIGDIGCILDWSSELTTQPPVVDNYPLFGPFSDFNATSEYHVQTICNFSISDFQFNGTAISFNVSDENGTIGFCRICIPTVLMNETYKVFVNNTEVPHTLLPCFNGTHSYLYFTYNHSTQEVIIIPDFPSFLILPLFIIATLLAVIVYRRKHST